MTETQIREWLRLAISSLCGDRIHFCTSNKASDQHIKDARQVQEWIDGAVNKKWPEKSK